MIVGLVDEESVCLTQSIQRRKEGDIDPFKFFEVRVFSPDKAVFDILATVCRVSNCLAAVAFS